MIAVIYISRSIYIQHYINVLTQTDSVEECTLTAVFMFHDQAQGSFLGAGEQTGL